MIKFNSWLYNEQLTTLLDPIPPMMLSNKKDLSLNTSIRPVAVRGTTTWHFPSMFACMDEVYKSAGLAGVFDGKGIAC